MILRPAGVREHVPLAPLTTFEVGGPARFFFEPTTVDEVQAGLAWAAHERIAVIVLGGGSNVVVADRGVDALVLRPRLRGVHVAQDGAFDRVTVGAGEPWAAFVSDSVDADRAGVECLAGIPGDVGAVPIQNVGAYGQEVADTLCEVEAVERDSLERLTLARAACEFGYRDSIFKRALRDRVVVVAVSFRLLRGGTPTLRYAELKQQFEGKPAPGLRDVRDKVLVLRRNKSMLVDVSDENHRSAGSFFMNPVVSAGDADRIEERARAFGTLATGEKMPRFAAGTGAVKLSAGWLIERSGLAKGTHRGAVGLSTRHALAVVNRGGARASDIVAFARGVQQTVAETLGVSITPEPTFLGFHGDEVGALWAPEGTIQGSS